MTQDEARRVMDALIAAWGGRDNVDAMERAKAIFVQTEPWARKDGVRRAVLRWIDGKIDVTDRTIAAIEAMAKALSGLASK